MKYKYQVVKGAGIFGGLDSIQGCKKAIERMHPDWGKMEIERVLELPSGGRRYWRKRNGKWTTNFQNYPDQVNPIFQKVMEQQKWADTSVFSSSLKHPKQ